MRVLVTTSPGAGHVFPMIPLTWALRSAGHDVLVASAGRGAELAPAAGLSTVDVAPGVDIGAVMRATLTRLDGPASAGDPVGGSVGFDRAVALFTEVSRVTLDGVRRWVRDWEPDLVLYGALQAAGAVAAAEHGVPAIEHMISPAGGVGDIAAAAWSALTDLPPVPPAAAVGIVPERFGEVPSPGWAMRMVPYSGGALVPEGVLDAAQRPRVLVTMGTVAPAFGGVAAMRAVVDALAAEPWEVLVALGADPSELGAVPPSVRVHPWVPLSAALPRCRAVVHHGGAGTTLAALAAGVGQVLVPQGADQFGNAGAMVREGIGLQVDLADGPEAMVAAVRRVVDGGLSEAVRSVAAEMAALPPPSEVAAAIGAGAWRS